MGERIPPITVANGGGVLISDGEVKEGFNIDKIAELWDRHDPGKTERLDRPQLMGIAQVNPNPHPNRDLT